MCKYSNIGQLTGILSGMSMVQTCNSHSPVHLDIVGDHSIDVPTRRQAVKTTLLSVPSSLNLNEQKS